jgi:ribonuclease HI
MYASALAIKYAVDHGYRQISIKQDCKAVIDIVLWIQKHATCKSWTHFQHTISTTTDVFQSYNITQENLSVNQVYTMYPLLFFWFWYLFQYASCTIDYVPAHIHEQHALFHGISHQDWQGNEEADRLARQAARLALSENERTCMDHLDLFRVAFPPRMSARENSWLRSCTELEYQLLHCIVLNRTQRLQRLKCINVADHWNTLSTDWKMLWISWQDTKLPIFM